MHLGHFRVMSLSRCTLRHTRNSVNTLALACRASARRMTMNHNERAVPDKGISYTSGERTSDDPYREAHRFPDAGKVRVVIEVPLIVLLTLIAFFVLR